MRGVRAEQSVARTLRRLLRTRPYFYLVNGMTKPRGDIDHVVVGPTGVFAVETKGYRGTVRVADGVLTVNGFRPDRDPLRQARRAAAIVRRRLWFGKLKVSRVQAVLCLPYADLERPQCAGGVLVTRREHLGYLIRHWQGQQLNAEQAARVFEVLQVHVQRAAA